MRGITLSETKRLFEVVESVKRKGGSINEAFLLFSAENGKSVGSVRNYYYAQLRLIKILPEVGKVLGVSEVCERSFELFTDEEIYDLIETVLTEKVKGKSVRAILTDKANGDKKKYLRFQNKYRTLIAKKRKEVYAVLNELSLKRKEHYDPFSKKRVVFFDDKTKENQLIGFIKSLDAVKRQELLAKINEN